MSQIRYYKSTLSRWSVIYAVRTVQRLDAEHVAEETLELIGGKLLIQVVKRNAIDLKYRKVVAYRSVPNELREAVKIVGWADTRRKSKRRRAK